MPLYKLINYSYPWRFHISYYISQGFGVVIVFLLRQLSHSNILLASNVDVVSVVKEASMDVH
jgi:hypothetical protein